MAAQICLILGLLARGTALAQDPATMLPGNYRVVIDNDWVRVLRVRIPAGAHLPSHDHPAALIAYVYLNDADPIVFKHDGGPGTIRRPAVKARSYRLSTGTGETHAIENDSKTDSIYLRIEYKTEGSQSANTRRRTPAPPPKTATSIDVEFTNAVMRITRITIGGKETVPYESKKAGEPAVIVPVNGTDPSKHDGLAYWISPDARNEQMVNSNDEAREYLRFDFLTPPSKK